MRYTVKAQTFNGNVVTGKGDTSKDAMADANFEANKLGSCTRKILSTSFGG